jgi:hypothetical protein
MTLVSITGVGIFCLAECIAAIQRKVEPDEYIPESIFLKHILGHENTIHLNIFRPPIVERLTKALKDL